MTSEPPTSHGMRPTPDELECLVNIRTAFNRRDERPVVGFGRCA